MKSNDSCSTANSQNSASYFSSVHSCSLSRLLPRSPALSHSCARSRDRTWATLGERHRNRDRTALSGRCTARTSPVETTSAVAMTSATTTTILCEFPSETPSSTPFATAILRYTRRCRHMIVDSSLYEAMSTETATAKCAMKMAAIVSGQSSTKCELCAVVCVDARCGCRRCVCRCACRCLRIYRRHRIRARR